MPTDAHRAEHLKRLPPPYANVLRLRDAGIADDVIAQVVGVDPDALPTLMRVAKAKLAAASESHRPNQAVGESSDRFACVTISRLLENEIRTSAPAKICR